MRTYPALRTIAVVFKVIAWIALVSGVLALIGGIVMASTGEMQALSIAFAGPLLGLLYFVMLYSSAEMIYVLIDIADNTRKTAEAVAALQFRGGGAPPVTPPQPPVPPRPDVAPPPPPAPPGAEA
jgi:hypothetical protein